MAAMPNDGSGILSEMNFAAALFYPVILLLPVASTVDSARPVGTNDSTIAEQLKVSGDQAYFPVDERSFAAEAELPGPSMSAFSTETLWNAEPASAAQVRIEQRMTIRITPRGPRRAAPDMLIEAPEPASEREFVERKIGKCVPVSMIGGVQPGNGNRLLLFMRDRRVVSAELERSCRSGAFYSGFLLSRSSDGQLCVDRDTLQSRSGSKCKLTRIRQLVEEEH
jgi:hypothetical protein